MDINALDQAIGKTSASKGKQLSLASIAHATFMTEMKEASDRSVRNIPRADDQRPASSQMKQLAFRSDPLPAPRQEPADQKTQSAFSDDAPYASERAGSEASSKLEEEDPGLRTSTSDSGDAEANVDGRADQDLAVSQVATDSTETAVDGMPTVPQNTPLPVAFSDGTTSQGTASNGAAAATATAAPAPTPQPQASTPHASSQTPVPADASGASAKPQQAVQASQSTAPNSKDGATGKPSIPTDTSIKISVDATPQTTGQVKALPSMGGTLFQAQQAAANGMSQPGVTLPSLGHGAGGTLPAQGTASANGGQPMFVGADGGAQAQNAGANGGQSGGQQSPQGGGQGAAGQPGFQFGQSTNGKSGFGNEATRAQFQDIMMTRTARPSALGNAHGGLQAGNSGSSTATLASSSGVAAGLGGPQSTSSATMASPVAQATSGRPGATPGAAVDQVAVKLTSTAKDGGGKISIRLNPEELGKVDVKLEIGRDGAVRATVSADRPETLDLMQRDARALEKALQDAGLKTDSNSLQFEKHDGQNAAGRQDADNDTGGAGASDEADGPDDLQDTDIDTASGDGIADDGSLNLVA